MAWFLACVWWSVPGFVVAAPLLPQTPSTDQWIYDTAHVISEPSLQHINAFLSAFHRDTGIECFALSLPNVPGGNMETFTNDLFEHWKIGRRTKGRGLLFVLAVHERLVRLEVSYELEPTYTDTFVSYIEHEQMVPFFEQNHIGDGVEATLELIVQRFQQRTAQAIDSSASDRHDQSSEHLSGGAGVKTGVALGARTTPEKTVLPTDAKRVFSAQPSPDATFTLYLKHLQQHITDPDLGIFTPATREFFRRWTVTNAQMDNEYRDCAGKPYDVRIWGDRAVIRFSLADRTLSPYFLEHSADGWQLDMATMTRVIRFNTSNQWHFVSRDHPYMFAFADCTFDAHGFPFPSRQ